VRVTRDEGRGGGEVKEPPAALVTERAYVNPIRSKTEQKR